MIKHGNFAHTVYSIISPVARVMAGPIFSEHAALNFSRGSEREQTRKTSCCFSMSAPTPLAHGIQERRVCVRWKRERNN